MRSETSFFNKTLFLKNILRFWPVWAFYTLIWLYVMPVGLWSTISSLSPRIPEADIMRILVSQVHHKCFDAGSTLTAVFGILAAMSVFSYLFSIKSAGFFHALPIKREGLFITNYLSGLSFLIVPAFIVFIMTAALLSLNGFLSIPVLLS